MADERAPHEKGNGVRRFWSDTRIHVALITMFVAGIVTGVRVSTQVETLIGRQSKMESDIEYIRTVGVADRWTGTDHDRYALGQARVDELQNKLIRQLEDRVDDLAKKVQ